MSECFVQSVQGKGSGKNFMQFLELIAWKVCHLNPNLGFAKNTSLMSEAAVWWDLQNLWIREGSEWTRLQRWAVIINIMSCWLYRRGTHEPWLSTHRNWGEEHLLLLSHSIAKIPSPILQSFGLINEEIPYYLSNFLFSCVVLGLLLQAFLHHDGKIHW
jgi:hypothetical protein